MCAQDVACPGSDLNRHSLEDAGGERVGTVWPMS
jgi:hypothetical protein